MVPVLIEPYRATIVALQIDGLPVGTYQILVPGPPGTDMLAYSPYESISTMQLFNQCYFDINMFHTLVMLCGEYHRIFVLFANVNHFCH